MEWPKFFIVLVSIGTAVNISNTPITATTTTAAMVHNHAEITG